jgi:hypothetical protein
MPVRFLLTIFIAILFHSSVYLALLLYFIPYFSRIVFLWVIFLLSLLIAASSGLGFFLTTKILSVLPNNLILVKKLTFYITSQYFAYDVLYRPFGRFFLIHAVMTFFMLFFYESLVRRWDYNRILIPMYVYGTVIFFCFINFGFIARRMVETFCSSSEIIIIPSFLLLFKKRERMILYFVLVCYCIILFWVMVSYNTLPYQSVLQFLF